MHCEPAAKIILLLGGLSAVAEAANTTATTVQRWRLPAQKGGTGGYVPRKYHDALIKFAKAKGIALPPVAFLDATAVPVVAA